MNIAPEQLHDPLEELRAHLTRRLAQIVMVGSPAAMYWTFTQRPFDVFLFALFGMMALLGLGLQKGVGTQPVAARHTLLWGLILSLLVAMMIAPNPWVPFLGIFVTLIASLLVARSTLVTVLILLGFAAWLSHTGARDYPLPELLVSYVLGTVLAWRTVNILYMAVTWYSTMQQQADRLLQETRDNRADLKQALKSLEIAYDIRHKMQRELVQTRHQAEEARRLKERFAANISHELRTPLNLILGFSEVMHLSPEVYGDVRWTPPLRRDIYQIFRSSRHLMGMIDDILDLSHFELSGFTVNLEPTNLELFLDDTVGIVRDLFRNHPVQLEVEIETDLPPIDIDRTRIRQVLLNLLTNAKRFTTEGVVRLEARRQDREVVISITDTGPGISADKLPSIFDEFYQVDYSLSRDHGGAGLGLAISKRFVEAHKGIITVTSQEGVGSTFSVNLPLPGFYPTREGIRSPLTAGTSSDEPPSRLLVIGSDPAVATMIQRHLDAYEVKRVATDNDLDEAIATHQPLAVIRNVIPAQRSTDDHATPYIECTLPSPVWMVDELSVNASLAKPISAKRLIEEIQKLNDVQNVLVVDDDRGFVQLVERFLHTHNQSITVQRAYDGEEGLAIMQQNSPDLLLLDLAMPGTDGFEVLRRMQAQPEIASIPVILLTATNYAHDNLGTSSLAIHWAGGLFPADVLSCLRATVGALKPHHEHQPAAQKVLTS